MVGKIKNMQQEFFVELCAKHLIHERIDPITPGLIKICLGAGNGGTVIESKKKLRFNFLD